MPALRQDLELLPLLSKYGPLTWGLILFTQNTKILPNSVTVIQKKEKTPVPTGRACCLVLTLYCFLLKTLFGSRHK